MTNLITFKSFCLKLNANQNTVKTWKRRGDLPPEIFFKIGGTLYVLEDKFDEWVQTKQRGGIPSVSL